MICPICQNKKEENKHCKTCAIKLKENITVLINDLTSIRAFLQGLGWSQSDYNYATDYEEHLRCCLETVDEVSKHIITLEQELEIKNKPAKKVTPIPKDNMLILPYTDDHNHDVDNKV